MLFIQFGILKANRKLKFDPNIAYIRIKSKLSVSDIIFTSYKKDTIFSKLTGIRRKFVRSAYL